MTTSVLDRWQGWRDRLLVSERFRRWALAFPLTRRIARRRARALFDLVAGFVYSQVLLACVRLRVFDRLADGVASLSDLAVHTGLDEPALRRLLDAAVSLDLLERRGLAQYGLGPRGAPLAHNPGLTAMVEHHSRLYADLQDPVALLRGDRAPSAGTTPPASTAAASLAAYWPYAGAAAGPPVSGEQVAPYSALMSASQPLVAQEVLDAYPLQRHRCLLDVGGGEGRFLQAAGQRAPGLRLMLFDLPAVAERARQRLDQAGLSARCDVHGGDFLRDPLPVGADLVSLVRVVHDHDDDAAMALLRAVHAALPKGGTLLLAEPMAGTPGAQAMGDAYFGFYLLAMGSGRPRRAQELTAMLHEAGFAHVRQVRTRLPLQTSLLVARARG